MTPASDVQYLVAMGEHLLVGQQTRTAWLSRNEALPASLGVPFTRDNPSLVLRCVTRCVRMTGTQVFAWDNGGRVDIESLRCLNNIAPENGGCFYSAAARSELGDEVLMSGNLGEDGGCICEC